MSSSIRHYALNDIFAALPPAKAVLMLLWSLFVGQYELTSLTPLSEPMITLTVEHCEIGN
jgi:hypothetical protein